MVDYIEVEDFELECIGEQDVDVYDIEVEDNHNFFGNNFLLHNSNYIHLKPFVNDYVKKTGKGFDNDEDTCKFLIRVSDKVIQPAIEGAIIELTARTNCFKNTLKMDREKIMKKMILIEKKKYICHVKDDEGLLLTEPKLSVTGFEIVRTSTPQVVRDKLKGTVNFILDDTTTEDSLRAFISSYKKEWMELTVEEISNPKGVSDVVKYEVGHDKGTFAKGCPIHVRSAIMYNYMRKKFSLQSKYPAIHNGEKIKYTYLKKGNPLRQNIIGYPQGYNLPEEFGLHKFVDYNMQFEKTYMSPVIKLANTIGWDIMGKKKVIDLF